MHKVVAHCILLLTLMSMHVCYSAARPTAVEPESTIPSAPELDSPGAFEQKGKSEEAAREIKVGESEVKAAEALSKRLLHDVLILLDNSEKMPTKKELSIDSRLSPLPATVCELVLALCQEASPIIVSGHTVQTFLKWRHLSDSDTDPSLAPIKNMIISGDWDAYRVSDGSLILFIPRTYRQAQLNYYTTAEFSKQISEEKEYTAEEIILGFTVVRNLEPFPFDLVTKKRVTPEEEKELARLISIDSPVNVATLKNMFVTGKNEVFGFWNIVMTGHGNYGGLLFTSPTLKTVEESLVSDVVIAGLPLVDFKKWLQVISTDLNTNFLYYITCYGGDVNLHVPYTTTFINETGVMRSNITQAHFTIVAGCLTSSVVWGIASDSIMACINKNPSQVSRDYKVFFDRLHYISATGDWPKRFTDQELVDISTPLTVRAKGSAKDPWGISGLPMVKDTLSDSFRPFPLNKNIHVINNVSVQKKIKEKGSFTFKNAEAILIATPEVPVAVTIEVDPGRAAPALVSLVPRESLITFESLEINRSFSNFFVQSLGAITYTKFFYFKKLRLINDVFGDPGVAPGITTLTDVLVYCNGEKYEMIIFFTGHLGKKYLAKAFVPTSIPEETRIKTSLAFFPAPAHRTSRLGTLSFQTIIKENSLLNAFINYFFMYEKGSVALPSVPVFMNKKFSEAERKIFEEGKLLGNNIVQDWEEEKIKQQKSLEEEKEKAKSTTSSSSGSHTSE